MISPRGKFLVKRLRVKTPNHRKPAKIVKALADLVAPIERFDHVSIGFPGMCEDGKVFTAPHFGTKDWAGFDLAAAMRQEAGQAGQAAQ